MATQVEMMADGAVATLRFSTEGKPNVLSAETLEALERHIDALAAEPAIRVCILTGVGKTFLAGANIRELAALAGPDEARKLGRLGNAVLCKLADCPAISIAAINGLALGGGCEVALACDFRLLADDAKIGFPEATLGLIPGWGGTQRLARLIGPGRAKELILTGQPVDARSAQAIGLVHQVTPGVGLLAAAAALAQKLQEVGPRAARLAKQAIDQGLRVSLLDGLEVETDLFARCFEGEEAREGLAAFLEKRGPKWRAGVA